MYCLFQFTEEIYISIKSYQAKADDELSFDADVMLKVVEKTLDGWWLVRYTKNPSLTINFIYIVAAVIACGIYSCIACCLLVLSLLLSKKDFFYRFQHVVLSFSITTYIFQIVNGNIFIWQVSRRWRLGSCHVPKKSWFWWVLHVDVQENGYVGYSILQRRYATFDWLLVIMLDELPRSAIQM